jgi:hypothetical protein
MEALSRLVIWVDSISRLIPEQIYITLMNYLKDVHEEIESEKVERCKATKWNGNRCRQEGQPNQTGGPIIDGYCSYHKKFRKNS